MTKTTFIDREVIDKAEGTVKFTLDGCPYSFPFDTQLVNANGVNVHFWTGYSGNKHSVPRALTIMKQERDVVTCTYSFGKPTGFWPRAPIVIER